MKTLVIDIHAHFTPKLLIKNFDAHAAKFSGVKLLRDPGGGPPRIQFPGTEPTRPVFPRLSDLADRRAWMDKNGIDHQLVGGWLDSFGYELPAREGLAWSRFINDCMWDELHGEPRFTPLATVPLQDGKLAAEVLGEAMDRGFGGVRSARCPRASVAATSTTRRSIRSGTRLPGWAPPSICTRCSSAASRGWPTMTS